MTIALYSPVHIHRQLVTLLRASAPTARPTSSRAAMPTPWRRVDLAEGEGSERGKRAKASKDWPMT